MSNLHQPRYFGVAAFIFYVAGLLSPNFFPFLSSTIWLPAGVGLPNAKLLDAMAPLLGGIGLFGLLLAVAGRFWIACFLLLPFWVLLPFEWFHIGEFGTPSSAATIAIAAETNSQEAMSYLSGRIIHLCLATVALTVLGVIVVIAVKRAELRWSHRSRWWLVGGSVLIGIASFVLAGDAAVQEVEAARSAGPVEDRASVQFPQFVVSYTDAYPFGVLVRIAEYQREVKILAALSEKFNHESIGASRVKPFAAREIYVLVIGESSRYDRWGINGYSRNTNPRLAQEANLLAFTDAVSLTAATRTSVPIILTARPKADRTLDYKQQPVIAAFKEAGFSTYWLSTQPPLGFHETLIAALARRADHVEFLNHTGYEARGGFDGLLLTPLAKVLAKNEPRQFIVLHTLGSHANYRHRYPDEFGRWQPTYTVDDNPSTFLSDKIHYQKTKNAYDNSILYTDYILAEVIARLRATGAATFVLYSADHGETQYDGTCGRSAHGIFSRFSFHIPLLTWHSNAYSKSAPEVVEALRSNRERPTTTESVYHTLLDAARIEAPTLRPERSLANMRYVSTRRHISMVAGDSIDFDTELPRRDCSIAVAN